MGHDLKLVYPPGATPLDPNEIDGLIPTSIATQGDLNAFEQANIVDAETWALKTTRDGVLTDHFVRGLHRRMFGQVWRWAGTYRKSDKNIGKPWVHIPESIRHFCADAAHWIENRTYEWDELGARFHHRLVCIHPFANGNGRHARLMTDVLLRNHDVPLFTWGGHTLAAGDARGRYLAALRAADDHHFEELVGFVRS